MPDTENPRSHIQPVPLPIPSQIPHLRSSNQEGSCDWENYERRKPDANWVRNIRGTQREYSSNPLKHSTVKRILVFKR